DRVIHADEIERLVTHYLGEIIIAIRIGRRSAYVTHPSLFLQFFQDPKLRRNVRQVVYLDQVDRRSTDAFERRPERRPRGPRASRAAAPRGDICPGRAATAFLSPEVVEEFAGCLLRSAMARSRIDKRATILGQRSADLAQPVEVSAS